MRTLRLHLALVLLLAVLLLAGCARQQAGITVAGSTSVQPFAELLAEEYMHEYTGEVVNVQGGGSSAGVQATLTGAAHVGMSSRALKPAEEAEVQTTLIALDAIAIIVHPSSPVDDLTIEQVRDIFAGRVKTWRAFGGTDKPITIVTREEGSGTRGAFQELVMGAVDIHPGSIVQDSNGAVRQVVADDPNAVGYISLGLVNEQVKAVPTGGIEPSNENVVKGTYQLARPFLLLTKGTPLAEARAFIAYTLSPEGQAVLASEGLVPAP